MALLPLLLAVGTFSISLRKPLPSWARNWFFRKIGAPEIFDRVIITIVGLFFISLAVVVMLAGVLN